MNRTAVKRLHILLCGFEILPKTVSTRGRGGRFILSEPVCAYLLDTDSGWVLLDAGLNPANGRDRGRMDEKFWRFGDDAAGHSRRASARDADAGHRRELRRHRARDSFPHALRPLPAA